MKFSFRRIKNLANIGFGSARNFFEEILAVLLSDTSSDQAFFPINKTGVGIRRTADQVQAEYIGPVFQCSDLVKN